ncbi:DUF3592 domain-containing protein [Longispora sp. K20-0274]|uniref:DUF3592 domain-containing protein n=1 Tax=Longispora sp. K20-0274 TaxID=3088255 RepID=UPI00399BAA32
MQNPPAAFVAVLALVSLALLALPVGVIVAGVRQRRRNRRFRDTARPATATVLDNQMVSGPGSRIYFRPVVRFATDSGTEVTSTAAQQLSSGIVGSTMAVLYDPADPSRVEAASGTGPNGTAAIIIGVVGLAFALTFVLVVGDALAVLPWSEAADCPPGFHTC